MMEDGCDISFAVINDVFGRLPCAVRNFTFGKYFWMQYEETDSVATATEHKGRGKTEDGPVPNIRSPDCSVLWHLRYEIG